MAGIKTRGKRPSAIEMGYEHTKSRMALADQIDQGMDLQARSLFLTQIEPDPTQPRRFYAHDDARLRTLADNIRENGLINPITVRPHSTDADRYVIVSGERRWKAAHQAGLGRIRVVVRDLDPWQVRAVQYSENYHREDMSEVAKARSLESLYSEEKKRGGGWESVSKAVGLSRQHVLKHVGLLGLPEPVLELIDQGLLSPRHGYELKKLVGQQTAEDIVTLAQQCRARTPGGDCVLSSRWIAEEVTRRLSPSREDDSQHTADVQENVVAATLQTREVSPAVGAPEVQPSSGASRLVPPDVNPDSPTGNPLQAFLPHGKEGRESARPHVRQVIEDVRAKALTENELRLLQDALAGSEAEASGQC